MTEALRSGVSVVINTLDERENIAACIASVRSLADEIVVCDMHSSDGTADIAREAGARVVLHERAGFVEPARRFAIGQAQHEWVLILDADERMTAPLARRLREAVEQGAHDVVAFWSLFWYFGGWVRHGGFFHGHWPRMFRKRTYLASYRESEAFVHRNFEAVYGAGRLLQLSPEFYIEHLAYPTVEKYVTKTLGRYARLEAEQLVGRGVPFSVARMLWEPAREFLWRYLYRGGFRDGVRGLVLASLFSAYRFCMWSQVWQLRELEKKSRA